MRQCDPQKILNICSEIIFSKLLSILYIVTNNNGALCKNIYYDEKHDVFCLRERHGDPENKNRNIAWVWLNDYFFELLYLDPEIKKT